MNMLIIGNGFDLAHKRPTRYEDFLKFTGQIVRTKSYHGTKDQFEATIPDLHIGVKQYILSAFDTCRNRESGSAWNKNKVVQELYECLDRNVWYEYFQLIYKENEIHGKNWIDFEGEIREVIEFFDREIENIYDQLSISSLVLSPSIPAKISFFSKGLDFSEYNQIKNKCDSYKNTYSDLIEKTYQDLEKFIRCLEIYLNNCVEKMPITCYSPDIKELSIDSVLSFNYTAIPTDIYPSLANTHYIHGCAKSDRPAVENNMVLGVNEYWEGLDKNTHTNFNLYKKFVQRLIKETGIDYKKALEYMRSDDNKRRTLENRTPGSPYINHIYIFGHSLDVTDGDILREVMGADNADTTIFYKDKQQQANQIANLSKVMGQDELLTRTFSTSPTIIFKQQSEMAPR